MDPHQHLLAYKEAVRDLVVARGFLDRMIYEFGEGSTAANEAAEAETRCVLWLIELGNTVTA